LKLLGGRVLGRECHCGLLIEKPTQTSHLFKMRSTKTTCPVLFFNSLLLVYTNKPLLRNGKYEDTCPVHNFNSLWLAYTNKPPLKIINTKTTCPVLIFSFLAYTN
jgi:hypothetical protein